MMFLSKLLRNKISQYKRLFLVENRLGEIFKEKFEGFKEILSKSNGAITGSFLIQCILNERWENSDIDVFIPYKKGFLSPSNNKSSMVDQWILDNGGQFYGYVNSENYDNLNDKLIFIRNYKINQFNVQTIIVDNDNIEEYVNHKFDFDICKNVYKGKSYLKFKDIDSILQKKCIFDFTNNIRSSSERKLRYEKRGFEITIIQPVVDKFEEIISNHYHIYSTTNSEIKKINGQIYDFPNKFSCSSNKSRLLARSIPSQSLDENFIKEIIQNKSIAKSCSDDCSFKIFGLTHIHLDDRNACYSGYYGNVVIHN